MPSIPQLAPRLVASRPGPGADRSAFPVSDTLPAAVSPPRRQATLDTAGAAPLVEMVLVAHFYRENGFMPSWATAT